MCEGCTCWVDSFHTLQSVPLKLDKCPVQRRLFGDHVEEELVDLSIGSRIIGLQTDGEQRLGRARRTHRVTETSLQCFVRDVFVRRGIIRGHNRTKVGKRLQKW